MPYHIWRGRRVAHLLTVFLAAVAPITPARAAYDLDVDSKDSVTSIARQLTEDMMTFYHGDEPGHVPGVLPEPPYYWWEGGALMGALIEYWFYTKDDTYVEKTQQGLMFQIGEHNDYMPQNQTLTEGNDDQGFWGLAVMSAAEYNFPHPGNAQPSYLALAQAVFNTQVARWDDTHCGGGLRWQIFNWNKGWDYKNSISQGTFYALAARLALYTDNKTYAEWAEKTYDWMIDVEYIDDKWYVYDGAHIPNNCTDIVPWQFTYNAGCFIHGSAALYKFTGDKKWLDRLNNLLDGSKVFFTGPNKDIMEEVACEPVDRCNIDQESFKAYLSRWLAATTQWVPETYDRIIPYLRASAKAAVKQCNGGKNGRMCGLKWSSGKNDGTRGVGPQMAALEVTMSVIIKDRDRIFTAKTGGTSKGDPNAGAGSEDPTTEKNFGPITAGDRAGAAILTLLVLGAMLAGIVWMMLDETSSKSPMDQVKTSGAAFMAVAAFKSRKQDQQDQQDAAETGSANEKASDRSGSKAGFRVSQMDPSTGNVRRTSSMPIGWPTADSESPQMRSEDQRFSNAPRIPSNHEVAAAHPWINTPNSSVGNMSTLSEQQQPEGDGDSLVQRRRIVSG